jgi:hypothetical protein
MLFTHPTEHDVNRPIASHGWRKPDRALVIALLQLRLTELPANSIRRQAIERMIERAALTSSSACYT